MGLLGVVTEVTLRMEPLSKTAALTLTAKGDAEMARDAARLQQLGGPSTNVALLWRPDTGKYNAYILADAGNATSEAALYAFAARSNSSSSLAAAALAGFLETSKTGPGPTFSEATPPGFLQLASAFVKKSQLDFNETGGGGPKGPAAAAALDAASCGLGLGAQVLQQMASTRHALIPLPLGVGSTGSVLGNWQSPDSVIWAGKDGIALDEIELVIEQDDFEAWVRDVQLIFRKGLGGGGGPRCAPLAYFLIRYVVFFFNFFFFFVFFFLLLLLLLLLLLFFFFFLLLLLLFSSSSYRFFFLFLLFFFRFFSPSIIVFGP